MRDILGVVAASVLDMSESAVPSVPVWRLKFTVLSMKMDISCSIGLIMLPILHFMMSQDRNLSSF